MNRLLPFLLLLISSAALAESGAYRVEVIVLRNLSVESESAALQELRSFSHYPDSLQTKQPEKQTSPPAAESPNIPSETMGGAPRGDLPTDLPGNPPNNLPDDLKTLPQKSDYMNDVWRRLRGSQNYRPLVYTAWEQNRTDYYPPMRVHDENVITRRLKPPTNIMVADLNEEDPLAAYRSTFYQIDGSVQLRRSRFLHLYLDLEYRVNALTEDPILPVDNEIMLEPGLVPMANSNPAHEVFTLKQNRQIRTGEVQYFDTPYFGALVFVSAISAN